MSSGSFSSMLRRTKSSKSSSPTTSRKQRGGAPRFAFAFDIHGVLQRSGRTLEGATEVLTHLQDNRIPFILLTNSGGRTERARVEELSTTLRVPISVDQFSQAHTPMKGMVSHYKNKCVLVIGGIGNRCREVAAEYGFNKVITTADLITAYPRLWPFTEISKDYYQSHSRPLPAAEDPNDPSKFLKVSAIFVMSSPRDWGIDIQIITDLLLSHEGIIGTLSPLNGNSKLPNNGWLQDKQPQLYFFNPNFVYSTAYEHPRLSQGAFKTCLEAIFEERTEGTGKMEKKLYGKPYSASFAYAEKMLKKFRETIHPDSKSLSNVWFVGDNPAADIKGVNEYKSPSGYNWISLLVETGVYKPGDHIEHEPYKTAANVKAAVNYALKKEGYDVIP